MVRGGEEKKITVGQIEEHDVKEKPWKLVNDRELGEVGLRARLVNGGV